MEAVFYWSEYYGTAEWRARPYTLPQEREASSRPHLSLHCCRRRWSFPPWSGGPAALSLARAPSCGSSRTAITGSHRCRCCSGFLQPCSSEAPQPKAWHSMCEATTRDTASACRAAGTAAAAAGMPAVAVAARCNSGHCLCNVRLAASAEAGNHELHLSTCPPGKTRRLCRLIAGALLSGTRVATALPVHVYSSALGRRLTRTPALLSKLFDNIPMNARPRLVSPFFPSKSRYILLVICAGTSGVAAAQQVPASAAPQHGAASALPPQVPACSSHSRKLLNRVVTFCLHRLSRLTSSRTDSRL